MHAFVSGNVNEVRKLANDLLNACDTVKYCIEQNGEGTDFEIKYDNSGNQISIIYKGTGKRTFEEETKEIEEMEEVEEDKKSILDEVDGFDWDEE